MKARNIIVCLFWACALLASQELTGKDKKEKEEKKEEKTLTEYEKIFDKKENIKTRDGMMKLHFFEEKIIAEIPEKLLDKPVLMWNVAEKISDPDVAYNEMNMGGLLHLVFTRTDSLVNVRKMTATTISGDNNIREAMKTSGIGPIFASLPIKTFNPDSTAAVCDITDLFLMDNEWLHQLALPMGLFVIAGDYQKSDSFIEDIAVYDDHIEIVCSKNYKYGNDAFTTVSRSVMALLPENVMEPRIADERVGTSVVSVNEFSNSSGRKSEKYARRWRMDRGPVVFHVDTLFSPVWQKGIIDGIEKWNKAFERIGIMNAVKAVPYPKNDSTFSASNAKLNCVKYIQHANRDMRTRVITDPRSGEIIATSINVGRDLEYMVMQVDAMIQTGAYNPAVQGIEMPEKDLYEAVVAYTMRAAGTCLGLVNNYAAAAAYTVEQLRDPEFTQANGFASSVMTPLSYNYLLQKEDFERGATPVMTDLGPYDYYAIEWLYSDKEVDVITNDPLYKYVPNLTIDSRYNIYSLSNDPITASELALNNLKYVAANAADWVNVFGVDEGYALLIPDFIFLAAHKYFYPVYRRIGSFSLVDPKSAAKDGQNTYTALPIEEQKKAIRWTLEQAKDMKWIDNEGLLKLSTLNADISSMLESYIVSNAMGRLMTDVVALDIPLSGIDNLQKELLEYTASLIYPMISKSKNLTYGELIQFKIFVNMLQRSKTNKAVCHQLLRDARKAAEAGISKNKVQEQKDALRFLADSIR